VAVKEASLVLVSTCSFLLMLIAGAAVTTGTLAHLVPSLSS
jgi:hypothetical protein